MILAECSICQEVLGTGTNEHISALLCGHAFHATCIKKWLESSSTCPQCRIVVFGSEIIPRLFFSFIDGSSDFGESTHHANGPRPSSVHDVSSAHLEIVRLRGALSVLEARAKLAEQKINEQATEISTISELYRETNELYRLEHQKCLQARMQLAGYSRVVKEAQEIKDECFQLRQKTNELKDIEVLVRSNEDAAIELMQKYKNQKDDYSPETICNLFRWVAILRAELSEAQNRSRKYRTDAHRLRRAHAASTKLVADLERQVEQYKGRVTQMESEMVRLLEESAHSSSIAESFSAASTTPDCTSASTRTTTLGTESRLSLKRCLHLIDLPTPEINTNILEPKLGDILPKVAKVTPRVNPFKCKSTPGVKDDVDANKVSFLNLDPDEEAEQLLPRKTSDRRPSSLFKLAIMRDFNKKPNNRSGAFKSAQYNGAKNDNAVRRGTAVSNY
ncbi:traf interacting protein [Echinococcus multilocularis]|uniref:Traf interacting protein n=1 Tax=Echinococcus multilocularis TaxID=6211 RepID=A0A068YFT7_ECHMU|nr:traf interacting protein [Echinococcus multilocularis]